jgi:hypothetical protein
MSTNYVYSTVAPHPLTVPQDVRNGEVPLIDPEALETMRDKSKQWPDARWAACQNLDLSSSLVGHLKFVAVGPGRGVPRIDHPSVTHWAYYFVGWVNLDTGEIVPELP